jgi:Phosphotransferase enzyme family
MVDQTEYRLAFILPQSCQLLGIIGTGELPRISIPRWQRPAEQLTALIEAKWQIKTIVLDIVTDTSLSAPCAVIELRDRSWSFENAGFYSTDLDAFHDASLGDDERHILHAILSGDDIGRGPFSRIGWIEEAQQWIQDTVRDREIRFVENHRQLNVSGRFALIRFSTQRNPAYWLKAVGAPNEHEYLVTRTLTELFPNYLPTMVAAREDWNAWVMEDAGQTVLDSPTLLLVERAVLCLAELQIESIGYANALLSAGCFNCSLTNLEAHLGDIREFLEEVMCRQTSTKVPRIDKQQLRKLERVLRDVCARMRELEIPDTLLHGDTNPGNILATNAHCVFTDWCEAGVGNPFLTFQHICAQVSRDAEKSKHWLPQLREIYRSSWLGYLSEAQIQDAFAFMPLLAIAFCLYGRGDWFKSSRRDNSHFQSYSRALARHMNRAAQTAELGEALCR